MLVGIREEFFPESALLGSEIDERLVVEADAVMLGKELAYGTSSAAQLAPDGDDEVFHEDVLYYKYGEDVVVSLR